MGWLGRFSAVLPGLIHSAVFSCRISRHKRSKIAIFRCLVVGIGCQLGCHGPPSHGLSSSNKLHRFSYMADSRQHSMVEDKSCKASWVLSFETHRALLLPQMPVKKRHKTNQPRFKGWWNALHFWKRGAAKNLFYSLPSGHNYLHSLHMQNYSPPLKSSKKSHPITAFQNPVSRICTHI